MPDNEHWSNKITHEDLTTPEAKNWLSKYDSQEEALVGGYNAEKKVGKPFKLPESLEKVESWPDVKDREAFRGGLSKLLGTISKVEDLDDIDFAKGLPDARQVNAELVSAYKEFCVKRGVPKVLARDLAVFNNEFVTQVVQNQVKEKQDRIQKAQDSLKPLFGDDNALKVHDDRVRRLFQNHCGLSAQEYEGVIGELMSAGVAENATLRKALYNLSKDVVVEGKTEPAGDTAVQKPAKSFDQRFPETAKSLKN